MDMIVPSKSLISLRQKSENKPNRKNIFSNYFFFPLGRDALLYGLKALGVERGESIIIPAYMCSSLLGPLIDNDYNIIFQDINNDLNLDTSVLKENILKHDIKAVMAVSFFGFPLNSKEIYKVCSLMDVIFIEDYSHSFLSQNHFYKPLNFSDFSIYSIRKSLVVKDGGVLRINAKKHNTLLESLEKHEHISKDYAKLQLSDIKFIVLRFIEYLIIKSKLINPYSLKIDFVRNFFTRKKTLNQTYLTSHDTIKPAKPSFLLESYIYDSERQKQLKDEVINNYSVLTKELSKLGYKCLKPDISDNCIPQYVIVFDEIGGLVEWLRGKRIGATQWPGEELPAHVSNFKQLFPYANFYNDKLVMIPTHQSIKEKHIKKILDIMSCWKKSKN